MSNKRRHFKLSKYLGTDNFWATGAGLNSRPKNRSQDHDGQEPFGEGEGASPKRTRAACDEKVHKRMMLGMVIVPGIDGDIFVFSRL
jgi:hypothetical protein